MVRQEPSEILVPKDVAELAEVVVGHSRIQVIGSDQHREYRLPARTDSGPLVTVSTRGLSGIVDFSPDDQVVVVKAGTPIAELQRSLYARGQCLPLVEYDDGFSPLNVQIGTVGGLLSLNLPEYLEDFCGPVKDWVLGTTMVLADGSLAKSGSRAVKNVAGYDLHRFLVGSRGTLGIIVEVALRTYPVASLPTPRVRVWPSSIGAPPPSTRWIQRVQLTDYSLASEEAIAYPGVDMPGTGTLIRYVPADVELRRFPGDWLLRSGCGVKNLQFEDPTQVRFMQRAKDLFDPTHKLNPGELGIF